MMGTLCGTALSSALMSAEGFTLGAARKRRAAKEARMATTRPPLITPITLRLRTEGGL